MFKKISIALQAGLLMLLIGVLFSQLLQYLFPSIQIEYQNSKVFRSWIDPLITIYFYEPFIFSFILLWVYNNTKNSLKGETTIAKGLRFGIFCWAISIPSLLLSYSSFPISSFIILNWSLTSLAQTIIAGLLYAKLLP
jgi:hypothetical protein